MTITFAGKFVYISHFFILLRFNPFDLSVDRERIINKYKKQANKEKNLIINTRTELRKNLFIFKSFYEIEQLDFGTFLRRRD